jgi:hypothetical protein
VIRSKRFSESHLGIPEEMRWFLFVAFLLSPCGEMGGGLLDGLFLFWSHHEIEVPVFHVQLTGTDSDNGRFDLIYGALEPLAFGIFYTRETQVTVNVMVGKGRPIVAHGGFIEDDPIWQSVVWL